MYLDAVSILHASTGQTSAYDILSRLRECAYARLQRGAIILVQRFGKMGNWIGIRGVRDEQV